MTITKSIPRLALVLASPLLLQACSGAGSGTTPILSDVAQMAQTPNGMEAANHETSENIDNEPMTSNPVDDGAPVDSDSVVSTVVTQPKLTACNSSFPNVIRPPNRTYPDGLVMQPSPNTMIDLSGVLMEGQRNPSQGSIARFQNFNNVCVSGGQMIGQQDPQEVPWVVGHGTYNAGIHFTAGQGNIVVEDVLIKNSLQDGINLAGGMPDNVTFSLRGTHIMNNSDDGIQNDGCKKILSIEDVLIESKMILSMRPGADSGANSGSCGSYNIPIKNVLFNVICVADDRPDGSDNRNPSEARNNNCGPSRSASQVFKMGGASSKIGIDMSDSIVRFEARSRNGWDSMVWPKGNYKNVTVVWDPVQPGLKYDGPAFPPGVKFTTDKTVWTKARNAWLAAHPKVAE